MEQDSYAVMHAQVAREQERDRNELLFAQIGEISAKLNTLIEVVGKLTSKKSKSTEE